MAEAESTGEAPRPSGAADHIAAMVEPIKALSGVAGFVIGGVPTWRAGGAWPDVILHGLLGAVMLGLIGWFVGLVLIREAIRARVDELRAEYDERVAETRRQIVEALRSRGHDVPDAYLEGPRDRRELGSGT